MPAPSVTVHNPPPTSYPAPGVLRPGALVAWSGGVGPFDVLHEWDTDSNFTAPIQDSNTGASSPDTGTPPADMGPAGTPWFYRVTVTDTSDATATTSPTKTLSFYDPQAQQRYLYALANVGVAFDPTDLAGGVDGNTRNFQRFLYALANAGVGFDPTDTPAAGWDGEGGGEPSDGYTLDFARFLYQLANITTATPTPHIWYVFPAFGREGWEFQIIGYGFGDTQATWSGSVTLNGLAVGITSWELVAQASSNLKIDPITNTAEPVHQLIRAVVPEDAESGLVVVCTDGP